MSLLEIIQIIIAILNAIAGIFNPMGFDDVTYATNATEWQCAQPEWPSAPEIKSGYFVGTVEVRCQFEARGAGGLPALRRHMLEKLQEKADQIHSGPDVENYEGLPSVSYDVSFRGDSEGSSFTARGREHLATNGFTRLRHVFETDTLPANGLGRYLKRMRTEVEVNATERDRWFELVLQKAYVVKKPAFLSATRFRAKLTKESETELGANAGRVINDIATKF